ncbi:MAG: hypothetical protein UR60_C0018G0019 [Candidatus Moranbacteria bacterium GW2011_GWF2_34_56]|nr:MAG: hypothetical protein UR51_C0021G0019 [Candidatus Moranbacteria bacterium GW2011_GWF1_34_10]KKP64632.1 MAG: hypothetical protein UR60_C0018G0019 [Candidatus Moranbacteria bacterium GW2011_GWF2_34_56]HBI17127.1 hypothetical protein [Candidatus Moranbacteria bacterium]
MSELELAVKGKVQNLYVSYKRIQWEKICLLVLGLLPMGKFASKTFVYNRIIKWLPLDPENKKYSESVSKALYDLNQKRLIIKENIDLTIIGGRKFKRFCDANKEGEIITKPPKQRTQLVFRLPKEGEKVKIGILPQRIINRAKWQNFHRKKS